jgi:hypothetical protein
VSPQNKMQHSHTCTSANRVPQISQIRETKNRARRPREDHYTPEKFRMECVWKNLLRRYRLRDCRKFVSWSWRRDLNP